MTPFDRVFPDLARAEYAMFALPGRTKRSRETRYVFRELFCDTPRCDCGSVTILAIDTDTERIAAVIGTVLDPRQRSRVILDPAGPDDVRARELLELFVDMVAGDYRETLERHHVLWLSVRDGAGPARARKPARRRRGPATGVEIEIGKRARAASAKSQQRFARLVRKVEVLRARVRDWHAQRPVIDRGLAEYHAELTTQRDLARQFVEALDRVHADDKLSKTNRQKIRGLIRAIAPDLVEDGVPGMKELYDRHATRAYDLDAAEAESDSVATLRAMMETMGLDLGDAEIHSMDDLKQAATRALDAAEDEQEAARARPRKKSRKQLEREAAEEAKTRDASKVLQDVYRKLAIALHPDHERDPAEQARKTTLMQEVNAAYKAKDLLRLLELQLQFERVDQNAAEIAEERLVQYARILNEQAKQLEIELDDLELPWRVQLDVPPPTPIAPQDILSALHRDTEELRATIAAQHRDLEALADPKLRVDWLRTVPRSARRDGQVPF